MSADEKRNSPNCLRCKHFYVTWEQPYSRGCRAFGFKSQEIPSTVVFQTSGVSCQSFEEKPLPQPELKSQNQKDQAI